jgi:UDP-N-acetylmuramoyl-tripeptide--D-alanyl-D-alanine ligase
MIPMSLAEIAAVVDGTVVGDSAVVVSGAAFVDSRSPIVGGLFVAVVGERSDGHSHARAAVAAGAAAVLGSRATEAPTVVVADPIVALGLLARRLLDRLPRATVLALTGSQGKTGTKDYLAEVLSAVGPTVATLGNNNNELGVPLTVLRADAETAYVVVELGARGIGHIAYLCRIAPATIGAVLNIGSAHLGEFGSVAAIAQAKGELLEALPASGTAILNADDPASDDLRARTQATVLTFGESGQIGWRNLVLDNEGRASFELTYAGAASPVTLSQVGAHQVPNAAAAAAMAVAAGLGLPDIAAALTRASGGSPWRMEVRRRVDGAVVINDAYNANPASMRAALDALAAVGQSSRTLAVLGEMRELGEQSVNAHEQVGGFAAALGVDLLVCVGEAAHAIGVGALADPHWHGEVVRTAGRDDALAWLRENIGAGDVVLIKASRGAALEELAAGLLDPDLGPMHRKGDVTA